VQFVNALECVTGSDQTASSKWDQQLGMTGPPLSVKRRKVMLTSCHVKGQLKRSSRDQLPPPILAQRRHFGERWVPRTSGRPRQEDRPF